MLLLLTSTKNASFLAKILMPVQTQTCMHQYLIQLPYLSEHGSLLRYMDLFVQYIKWDNFLAEKSLGT